MTQQVRLQGPAVPPAAGATGSGAPDVPTAVATPAGSSSPRTTPGDVGGRRRSRAVPVLATLLVVVLVGAGALVAYLWRATDEWRASSTQWASLATGAASALDDTRGDLAAAQEVLAETRDQLSTAQDRITELADEKAQLGDDSAVQQQLADYQARVSQAAGRVATALATCIAGQQQLITAIDDQYSAEDGHGPTPDAVARFRADVDALCAEATAANEQLQTELDR